VRQWRYSCFVFQAWIVVGFVTKRESVGPYRKGTLLVQKRMPVIHIQLSVKKQDILVGKLGQFHYNDRPF